MEIQLASFALGIVSVLLIAVVIGGVYAVVKVMKLKSEVYNNGVWASQEFDNVKKVIETKDMELDHKIGNIYRDMDSRLDKLYDKIMKEVAPNRKFLQMIGNPPSRPFHSDDLKEDEDESIYKGAKRIMDKLDKKS